MISRDDAIVVSKAVSSNAGGIVFNETASPVEFCAVFKKMFGADVSTCASRALVRRKKGANDSIFACHAGSYCIYLVRQ